MKFKIIEDRGHYCVMYKKYFFSFWKYCRAPKTSFVQTDFNHIWFWNTKRGAQAFINQELKRLSHVYKHTRNICSRSN